LIERYLHKDGPYNDIQMWRYAELPSMFDSGNFATGIKVSTEEALEQAMKMAVKDKDKLTLIEACIPNRDCSSGLERLGNSFRKMHQKPASS
jgi:indolepyruvate decarboxylase